MKRFSVLGIALVAVLALSALTAGGAWASTDLTLLYQEAPAPVGETASAGILIMGCTLITEGTLTANKKPTDKAAFSTPFFGECEEEEEGYSITGEVKSAGLKASGTMSFKAAITLTVPGPCHYKITKYSVPFSPSGTQNTVGEGEVTVKLIKAGSLPSCEKKPKLPFTAVLLNHSQGLYSTDT
jgi:hypothetical protein